MASDLREQLRTILTSGLSEDPLEHAGQVARIAGVLHRAFGEAELRSTIVGGSAIGIGVSERGGDALFEIVKKEVVLSDRIVGFRQWEVLAWGQQAIDLLAAFGAEIDEAWLRGKLEHEGSLDALEPLRALAAGDERVTEGTLRELLAGLRGRTRR